MHKNKQAEKVGNVIGYIICVCGTALIVAGTIKLLQRMF